MCCYGHFLGHLRVYYVSVEILNLGVKTIVLDTKRNHLLTNVPFYL